MLSAKPGSSWYFGWNIVASATLLTLLTVGLRMSIGPFFLPIAEDLGFSRSLLAGIIAIGMLFYGIGMPLAGYLVAVRGTRSVLLWGAALIVLSIGGAVTARDPIAFMLAFGVGLSLGLAFISPVSLTPVISRWFTLRRGMALFFLSTGSMAGIAILTPALSYLIERYSWQATLLSIGAVLVLATVPIALFIVRDEAPAETDTLLGAPAARPRIRRIIAAPANMSVSAAAVFVNNDVRFLHAA